MSRCLTSAELSGSKKTVLDNKDVALVKVRQYAGNFQHCSPDLKADKEVVLAAIRTDGTVLRFASDELRNDPEVVEIAFRTVEMQDETAWKHTGSEVKKNRELVLKVVARHGSTLCSVADELKDDPEVVLTALRKAPDALKFASDRLRNDKDTVLAAVKGKGLCLKFASDELRADKDVVLAAVQSRGLALEFADPKFKRDREVLLAAVKRHGHALQFADQAFKGDKAFLLAALTADDPAEADAEENAAKRRRLTNEPANQYRTLAASALEHASFPLRRDRDVVLAAVRLDGTSLKHADVELRRDREIVLAAVDTQGRALEYASQNLCDDLEVVKRAIAKEGSAIQYASEACRSNRDLIFLAMATQPFSARYACGDARLDFDIIWQAVRRTRVRTDLALDQWRFLIAEAEKAGCPHETVDIHDGHLVVNNPFAVAGQPGIIVTLNSITLDPENPDVVNFEASLGLGGKLVTGKLPSQATLEELGRKIRYFLRPDHDVDFPQSDYLHLMLPDHTRVEVRMSWAPLASFCTPTPQ